MLGREVTRSRDCNSINFCGGGPLLDQLLENLPQRTTQLQSAKSIKRPRRTKDLDEGAAVHPFLLWGLL